MEPYVRPVILFDLDHVQYLSVLPRFSMSVLYKEEFFYMMTIL